MAPQPVSFLGPFHQAATRRTQGTLVYVHDS